ETVCLPTRHCTPGPRMLNCPSVFDALKSGIACGALHSDADRAHSHAHIAYGLSGSFSAAFHSPQPHDHTDAMPVSAATCCAASDCHFATSYHASGGWRLFLPPKPVVVAKLTIRPTRFAGIPLAVKSETACR